MKRHCLILLLIACAWPGIGWANPALATQLDNMQRWGSGDFRRYGFLIYTATLWAGGNDPTQPPLAISLTYKRTISAGAIVEASVDEIRKLGVVNEAQLIQWRAQMREIFPDVRAGDRILGLYDEKGARFFFNEQFIGSIESAEFARAFFGIWLDVKTSAPDLRNALLAAAPS